LIPAGGPQCGATQFVAGFRFAVASSPVAAAFKIFSKPKRFTPARWFPIFFTDAAKRANGKTISLLPFVTSARFAIFFRAGPQN